MNELTRSFIEGALACVSDPDFNGATEPDQRLVDGSRIITRSLIYAGYALAPDADGFYRRVFTEEYLRYRIASTLPYPTVLVFVSSCTWTDLLNHKHSPGTAYHLCPMIGFGFVVDTWSGPGSTTVASVWDVICRHLQPGGSVHIRYTVPSRLKKHLTRDISEGEESTLLTKDAS